MLGTMDGDRKQLQTVVNEAAGQSRRLLGWRGGRACGMRIVELAVLVEWRVERIGRQSDTQYNARETTDRKESQAVPAPRVIGVARGD